MKRTRRCSTARTLLSRWLTTVAVSAILAGPVLAGCTARTVSTTTAAPAVTLGAFEAFSGMVLPSDADHLDLRASTDEYGEPSYRIGFDLPTADIDQFSRAGQLDRPLRITTISARLRATFSYHGDASTGVRWIAGSLPSDMRIQREVFAVGTFTGTAHVQVHAYRMPR